MEEQEIVNSSDVYRDSSVPIPKEVPENRGTRIFVNIYFGFRTFVWFLSGFVPTVMLLVLTSMTQWKPIIMVQAPYFVLVGILFPFVSIHSLYTLLKVRTMSFKGWIFAFTIFIDSIISYLVMRVITIEMANVAVKATSGDSSQFPELFQSPMLNPSTLLFALIDAIIFGLAVFIWFKLKKKFTNTESKISKKAKYIIIGYTTFLIVVVTVIYTPFLIAAQEKPYIGYKRAEKELGRKPILFDVPEEYTLNYVYNSEGDGSSAGLVMMYIGDQNNGKINMILITENIRKSPDSEKDVVEYIDIDGTRAGYIKKESSESRRDALLMDKNRLSIMIAGINVEGDIKKKLIDVAKTAH